MSDITLLREVPQLLRLDFCAFVVRCFATLYPGQQLEMSDYIELMASRLVDVRDGRCRRLVVNLPPRHLKSLICSIAFPAWCLGLDPTAQIMCVSYGADLALKFARDTRIIMTSDWYRKAFPGTQLISQRAALEELITTAGGCRLANSVGGSVTGRGADLIIIDDPLKPDEALSDAQRQAVNEWLDGTLMSRLNDPRLGVIVLVMQRLHEDDLTGHVLAQEDWTLLRLAAIAEQDEGHPYMTPCGPREFRRRKGEALHPERLPTGRLEQIKRMIGSYFFAAQYQQSPAPAGGGIVRPEWFRRCQPRECPESFDRIVQSWDTANTVSELADYSVCTTWGIKGNHVYLLHVFRAQLEYPDLKRAIRAQRQLFTAGTVLIEDKSSGTPLVQELNREGPGVVIPRKPEGDKVMRMRAQTAMIEMGRVHIPADAPWLDGYLHEMAVFPKGRYDDQVDSTAQFLDWLNTPMPCQGAYEFMRREAERVEAAQAIPKRQPARTEHAIGSLEWQAEQRQKATAAEAAGAASLDDNRVRVRPPQRIGSLQTYSGVHQDAEPDGSFLISEEDAEYLIADGWKKVP